MNSDRVKVFHVADGNAGSVAVTHYLILYLFPSCDTSLYKYLSYS